MLTKSLCQIIKILVILIFPLGHIYAKINLPIYNVKASCSYDAKIAGNSTFLYNSCINQEQEAYNQLKSKWANIDQTIYSSCKPSGALSQSYFMLNACIDQELEAKNNIQTFKY